MIKRIVKMTIHRSREEAFLHIFENVKTEIRSQPGCRSLEVLRHDSLGEFSIWTISTWDDEAALDQYRSTALFKKTWSDVKLLFAAPAEAWTLQPLDYLP